MWLVHEDTKKGGRWQIAWMWLPHFLASDSSLHKFVAERMTEEFRGTMLEGGEGEDPPSVAPVLQRMHDKVIDLIVEKYPIGGLREYLSSITHVQPEEANGRDDSAAG